jgi:hypothetical protein
MSCQEAEGVSDENDQHSEKRLFQNSISFSQLSTTFIIAQFSA